jgi:TRAP-type C4-dicarboxylate transport system permease small subunit
MSEGTRERGGEPRGWVGIGLTLLARITLVIAGAALVGMAIVEGWQVYARYVLNDSPSWTEPVALLLMSTVMMAGAAIGTRSDAHFGFFIAVEHTPVRTRRGLLAIARLIAAAIGLMLSVWGGRLLVDGWDVPMAGAPLPQGIVFLPFCFGGALIALFAIERLITSPTSRTGE